MKPGQDLQKGENVQAVVIADSFDSKFGPLTATKPRCLLPLGNRPILSYTLEQLKISGVQECFVYCTSFAQAVKDFLNAWVEDQGSNIMTIHPITNEECHSFGDAMRDLDAKGVLRQDFILTFGDCIGNVNLTAALQEHKKRTKDDKNATMTMVYRKALPTHHLRTVQDEVLVAINEQNKVLYHVRPCLDKTFKVPLEALEGNEVINLKFDLIDPGLAICTQAVPPLFADNFDCQTLDEFVKGTLQDDLTDNTIYLHELGTDVYAARITSLLTYFAAQQDCLRRWMYPIVPELATGKEPQNMIYNRHNIYKSLAADLHKDSIMEEDVLVSAGTHVGENSTVFKTILGRDCHIGRNVSLKNAILDAEVKIGDGCQLSHCVIGQSVSLGKNVIIEDKCVLGDNVEVPDNVKVPRETWLVRNKPSTGFSDDEDSDDNNAETNFGPKAYLFKTEEEAEESDDEEGEEDHKALDRWGQAHVQDLDCEDSADSDEASDISDSKHEIDIDDDDAKFEVFHGEVFESLQRGAKEGVKVDNLVLEVNSSRHAYAITPTQVIQSVLTAILEIAAGNAEKSQKLLLEVKKAFNLFKDLMAKYIKSTSAQTDCLNHLESYCLNEDHFLLILAKMIHFMYEDDLLQEQTILMWFKKADLKVKEKVKPFIEWLAESSEEESD